MRQGGGTLGPDLAGPAHGADGADGKVTPWVSFAKLREC